MLGLSLGLGLSQRGGSIVSYSPEADALFAAMSVEPDATRKGIINTLIEGLIADGVWVKLDWLNLLAAHDAQAAQLNWITPAKTLTATNSPTFTTDRGYTGNGTNAFLDTGELPAADGNKFSQSSATMGVWCNQQNATGFTYHAGQATLNFRMMVSASSSGAETYRACDATNTSARTGTTRLGHRSTVRNGGNKLSYFDGSNVADFAVASTGVGDGNNAILRSGSTYSADRVAAYYTGEALSGVDIAAVHARLNTYLTAIGAA